MNYDKIQTIWTTFNGKQVSLSTIDQQHLSNCYWFLMIHWKMQDQDLFQIKEELRNRFNGHLLPYRPHISFKQEIDLLRSKGMLMQKETQSHVWEIIFKEVVVGEIVTSFNTTDDIFN